MKKTIRNLSITAALAMSLGTTATAATTDLAFIMDRSDSISETEYDSAMTSLANALDASIPFDEPDNQYSITVITFNNTSTASDVLVSNSVPTSAAELTAITDAIRGDTRNTSGSTCYSCAFDRLASTVTSFGANSIINMMTDGVPNTGTSTTTSSRDALKTAGWDSLSFEGVTIAAGSTAEDTLVDLAFDTLGTGSQPVITDPNDITDPLNDSFVLRVSNFGTAYDDAISAKVARIVNPEPINPIPLPAALPLLLSGLGMFGALRLRKSRKAAA